MSEREELLADLRAQYGKCWPLVGLRFVATGMGVVFTAVAGLAWWGKSVRGASSWPFPARSFGDYMVTAFLASGSDADVALASWVAAAAAACGVIAYRRRGRVLPARRGLPR